MCVADCQRVVAERLSRRSLFRGAASVAAAAVAGAALPARAGAQQISVGEVRDLTHTIDAGFPTYFGKPGIEMERTADFGKDGFNMFTWHLAEHTGTHLDAPIHFSKDGLSADKVVAKALVVPLIVLKIADKAEENADYQVSPDDVKDWEDENGPLPIGACVAMYSGWERHIGSDRFRNADQDGVMHFPGFHGETAELLLERNAAGIAVDTLSLDHGASKSFDVHYKWLPAGRWGLENVAHLGQLPALGATIVVGAPKVSGASGGPSRVFALL